MKTISASIICKNEEEMLPIMLESIKGVDEIVLLDTGSTDKSIEIAKSFGAKVFEEPWKDDFAFSRNECKKHCTSDFLLIIDCDEVLNTPIDRIKNLINLGAIEQKQYDLILFEVQTGVERNEQPRILRNRSDLWYYGAAHNLPRYFKNGLEQPEQSELIPYTKSFKSNCSITANISPNHQRDPDRTLRILENSLKKDPMNTRNLYYYVREWLNRREPIKALFYLDRYFKISQMTNERADAHFIAATCHLDLGDLGSAVSECMNCIKILPSMKAPYQLLEQITHPDMKYIWNRFANIADNKNVLFIRDIKKSNKQNLKIVKK